MCIIEPEMYVTFQLAWLAKGALRIHLTEPHPLRFWGSQEHSTMPRFLHMCSQGIQAQLPCLQNEHPLPTEPSHQLWRLHLFVLETGFSHIPQARLELVAILLALPLKLRL